MTVIMLGQELSLRAALTLFFSPSCSRITFLFPGVNVSVPLEEDGVCLSVA